MDTANIHQQKTETRGVYLHNEIPLSTHKEQTIDTCDNVNLERHPVEYRKPDFSKGRRVLFESTKMKFKTRSMVIATRELFSQGRMPGKEHREFSEMMKIFSILIKMVVTEMYIVFLNCIHKISAFYDMERIPRFKAKIMYTNWRLWISKYTVNDQEITAPM